MVRKTKIDKMDNNNNILNVYGYGENNTLYTWLEETRDWRDSHTQHLTESTNKIMENVDNTREEVNANVDAAETAILDKIEEHHEYVINNVVPVVNEIKNTVNEGQSTINNIWNKIRTAIFN